MEVQGNTYIATEDDILGKDEDEAGSRTIRRTKKSFGTYTSSRDRLTCIICNTTKKDKHGKAIPAHTMEHRLINKEFHLAEEQLVELWEIVSTFCSLRI